MAFLTQSFYSSSQTAPRRPQTQFLATQKFFVAPQQFLASRADQLFCQNQKNKSFKMSLDDWNKKNHFLKGKKKNAGGEGSLTAPKNLESIPLGSLLRKAVLTPLPQIN